MASVQIDMDKVIASAGRAMGDLVWQLTAELEATREANRVLEARVTELQQAAGGES